MSVLKKIIGATTLLAAGAAVTKVVLDDKKKRAELDAFLVPSEDGPVVIEPSIDKDMQEVKGKTWKQLIFSFKMKDKNEVKEVQESLEDDPAVLEYDEDNQTLYVIYDEQEDASSLSSIKETIKKVLKVPGAIYQKLQIQESESEQ